MQHPPPKEPTVRQTSRRVRHITLWVACLIGVVLLSVLLCRNLLLDRFLKPRIERAVAAAVPGSSLRIGAVEYEVWNNRFICRSIRWTSRDGSWSGQASNCSLARLGWLTLITSPESAWEGLRKAVFEARQLQVDFPKSLYALRCDRIRFAVPDASAEAGGIRFEPTVKDEEFFAARDHRRARLIISAPTCRIIGLDTEGLLTGKAFRAKLLEVSGAAMASYINRDKPLNPEPVPPLLINDVLATIPQPVELQEVRISDSRIVLSQRREIGQEPGVMPFESMQITGTGIRNHGKPGEFIRISGASKLMNAGLLKLSMSVPVQPSGYSFHYSGTLGAMDLSKLNPFVTAAGYTRIESGALYEAEFEAEVKGGHIRGIFRGAYENLEITLLNRETGTPEGVVNRLKSFVADNVILRTSNMPDPSGNIKSSPIDYVRAPNDKFFRFAWLGIRDGMFDLLGIAKFVKPAK